MGTRSGIIIVRQYSRVLIFAAIEGALESKFFVPFDHFVGHFCLFFVVVEADTRLNDRTVINLSGAFSVFGERKARIKCGTSVLQCCGLPILKPVFAGSGVILW